MALALALGAEGESEFGVTENSVKKKKRNKTHKKKRRREKTHTCKHKNTHAHRAEWEVMKWRDGAAVGHENQHSVTGPLHTHTHAHTNTRWEINSQWLLP